MAEFRKGAAVIKETAESKGGKRFTPNIYWKAGDIRTVVFVTPISDVPKVRLHTFIKVPDDTRDSGFRWETFLCRKDPSMVADTNGDCYLCDVVDHTPDEKFVALAVELEQIKDGKRTVGLKVKTVTKERDDGTEVDYPQWGMVTQGAKNFFAYLAAYDENKGDITEKAFEIHREGASIDTKYHFFAEDSALPTELETVLEEVPDLFSLLEEMGSDEKYEAAKLVQPGSQEEFSKNSEVSEDRETAFQKIKGQVEGY